MLHEMFLDMFPCDQSTATEPRIQIGLPVADPTAVFQTIVAFVTFIGLTRHTGRVGYLAFRRRGVPAPDRFPAEIPFDPNQLQGAL